MQITLDEATDPWGVKVEREEVKNVRLPFHLQRAMWTEAKAAREARAKVNKEKIFIRVEQLYKPSDQVIAAEGEQKASRALKEAAEVLHESPHALQVYGEITEEHSH